MKNSDSAKNDFSKGSILGNIMSLAIPMTLAQIVNVLYNIVDRIYIGRIPENATLSLTGLGLCLPIISIVIAFANLFGTGGSPLCSIERGRGDNDEAEMIMGNSFSLMLIFGIVITILCMLFKKPMLYLFGASDMTYPYADQYITIYLLGSIFVMIGLGMNSFINSQGFGKIGMFTVLLGAVSNIILDPIFIFIFNLGIRGAAYATVISQLLSAAWVLLFLTGKKAILKLRFRCFMLKAERVKAIVFLGLSGFTMSITNALVQIMYNRMLFEYGGDIYVAVMTVINSVREVVSLPVTGVTHGTQPVVGYNYGAGEYKRVKQAIILVSLITVIYTLTAWLAIHIFPDIFINLFNKNGELLDVGIPAMQIYFFGFFMMAFQFAGQSIFVGLGKSKQAVFFSIFRKVIIVIPMIVFLPKLTGLGTSAILMAEPISNFIGGIACYVTMLIIVWPELSGLKQSSH